MNVGLSAATFSDQLLCGAEMRVRRDSAAAYSLVPLGKCFEVAVEYVRRVARTLASGAPEKLA